MDLHLRNIQVQTALGLSAASALIYEVVATNILFFYFIRSSYSIATVLGVFLFGLGLGSLLVYFFINRIKDKKLLFGGLQIAIAIYALFVLTNLTEIVPSISTFGTFATSFVILLIPTVFLGAVFPLAGSLFKENKKEVIGLIYSSDLFGAILGSFIAGFLLIPIYGNTIAVIVGVALNLISAFIILNKKFRVIPLICIVFLLIVPVISPSILSEDTSIYQFYAPSPYGLVYVQDGTLVIDGRQQCSMCYPEDTSERMMVLYALDPLQQHNHLDVLNIGLGCGLTLEKILEYDTDADVVEINYQVVLANKVMTNILTHPRVNLIIDDGLNYLRYSSKKYDSILIDIENPAVAHSSNLYTVDAFEIISNSLADNGTFALWNFDGNTRYMGILAYSLKEVFPYVYSYPWVFLASKQDLNQEEYVFFGPWEINTIDKNTLTDAFLSVN